MTRLGAFVITFGRPAVLPDTLDTLLAQSRPPDIILVVDNHPTDETEAIVASYGPPRVRYDGMPENLGPAGAAARGLDVLTGEGYDWIYWGDDDDPPRTPDTLERLMRLATGHDDIAGVGAAGTRWDWSTGRTVRLPDDALSGVLSVDVIAGSSQLVLSAAAVREVGLPDADLFFGFEEPSYCLRLRQAGYRLLVEGELLCEYRRAAGRLRLRQTRAFRPRHSYRDIWRRYYSTRNYIHTMRTWFDRPDLARREAVKAFARILTSWARGPRYGLRFSRLQWRAVRDGYAGRLGCTVLPEPKDAD